MLLSYHRILLMVVVLLTAELVVAVVGGQYLNAFLVVIILAVTTLPLWPSLRRLETALRLPRSLHAAVVLFVMAALLLGEVRGYYVRIWWWDLFLHGMSGVLLGTAGFYLVYALNTIERVPMTLHPGFVAFFAFLFAIALGALWELFEFAVDEIGGMNMQKAMFDDPSGLTDTMWDMILNTVGAGIVSLVGWILVRRRSDDMRQADIRSSARVLLATALLPTVLMLGACGDSRAPDPAHNSRNSLDWAGTYEDIGTAPASGQRSR